MNLLRWLSVLFVISALTACVRGGQAPYAAYSPNDEERMDRPP
jgi:hypothetical protein